MSPAPALFVSHGSPMFAIEPGRLGPQLAALGRTLGGVRAMVVMSPHWQTRGLQVMATRRPSTVHDFGGFPEALYRLRYDAPGAPDIAGEVIAALRDAGLDAMPDATRGRDHGAWVPMMHLRPQADLPVIQVSLPHDADAAFAFKLGRALAPLRARGVMLVGSGSLTHNLYELRGGVRDPEYAQQFEDWVRDVIARGDVDALIGYRTRAPHAERAHPTDEHFLPLPFALGAANGDASQWIDGGMTYGTLSMGSCGWGLPQAA
ncbi:dioxygenase [Lysobacter sp. TY2-98]|uniref:DODA-type extradiol aromatic ring-opening family dioxygenase n=1 Tax=Lysobacter sp. TY2-98 TaxID=2290922 RepID=UPI000E20AE55|nr:class III extradiol ring-cleavage dioxygenase [Lysobacter sp. TY2-98]AXK73698.1 dioxygenase [Lysobacter sp. TY2-98]